ncbi:MAG: hypothetical protein J6T18_09270 [Bacteroidaceae bacterium]|nr:hypothetical protein [Bacteroidaceae bacterium]
MKKTLFSVFTMASLLVAGLAMISCDNKDNQAEIEEIAVDDPQIPAQTFTLTVNAAKGGDQTTRALTLDGENNIIATWSEDDVVKAYKGEAYLCDLKPEDISADGSEATLKGDFTSKEVAKDDVLTLKFLSGNYSSQDGTLTGNDTSIDKVCDYAIATVTVSSITGSSIYTTDAVFANQQAIVKFTLVDKADPTVDVEALSLVVTVGGSITYTVTPSSATNELWVAIPAIENEAISLEATTDGGTTFTFNKPEVTFENEQYYEINVGMKKPAQLPILAKVADFTYDGTDHALLTSTGTSEGVTIKYCISETEPTIDGDAWSEDIPEAENAGTYTLWYYAEIDEAYTGSAVSVTSLGAVVISKKNVAVTGITAKNKEYDGLTTDVTLNVDAVDLDADDIVAGDDVSFASATGNFADVAIGTGKSVTVDVVLSGAQADNYNPVCPGVTSNIIPFLKLNGTTHVGYYVCSDKSYFSPTTAVPTDGRTVIGMITAVTTAGSGEDGSTSGKGQLISAGEIASGTYDDVSGAINTLAKFGGLSDWEIPSDAQWTALGGSGATTLYGLMNALGDKITSVSGKTYFSTDVQGKKNHHWVNIETGAHDKDQNNHYGRGIATF